MIVNARGGVLRSGDTGGSYQDGEAAGFIGLCGAKDQAELICYS
jgi:hypothetical protein